MSPASSWTQVGSFRVMPRYANDSSSPAPVPQPRPVTVAAPKPHILPPGPPYPPAYAALGGLPSPIPDVPISAVFLGLFFIAAIAHIRIFRSNLAKSHRFVFSGAVGAFCIIRVASAALRITWAYHEENIRVAMAAQILVAAGVVILYITNLFFTQRLLFARHPGAAFKILILRPAVLATILTIIAVITVVVQSFYTLNPNTHRIDRIVQLYALTYLTTVAVLPIPTIFLMMLVPRHRGHAAKVASGRFGTGAAIILISSALLTVGAAWRCGTTWLAPVPLPESPWYFRKVCFYTVDFTVEILVVILFLAFRVDKRFYVPPQGQEAPPELFPSPRAEASLQSSGYASPDSRDGETLKDKDEKLPLFVQLVLEMDPATGKYHIGHESVLQQQPTRSKLGEDKTL